jgi:hypothetical protein
MQPSGDVWEILQDAVDAKGRPIHVELTARFDGRDYAVSGSPHLTLAFTRINDHTYEMVTKRDGKAISRTHTVISSDSRRSTSTTVAAAGEGQTLTNVAVYNRQ